ncbi:MAG: DUF1016 family protein [Bacteroidales bacterium]|nr:DUF1016 family protein [Candidatus Physcocola equi]
MPRHQFQSPHGDPPQNKRHTAGTLHHSPDRPTHVEHTSAGIVLCKEMNRSFVEYAVRDYTKPMGVATYRTLDDMPEPLRKSLPNLDDMAKLLNGD